MRKQMQQIVTVVATAVCGSDLPTTDHSSVHIGDYQFAVMSPEFLLTNLEWREWSLQVIILKM